MASSTATLRKIPVLPLVICAIALIALLAGFFYLNRPVPKSQSPAPVSAEANAYVANLRLSDVSMKASENLMGQQVVEVEGKITNVGTRPLESIDVYCLFSGMDGREIYRERLPIVRSKGTALASNESRAFRLPFDTLPEGWNQAMPRLVIAQIKFAR